MPTCHCAFKGCTTYTMHCSDTEHWGLEKWLYEHLLAVHVEKELCEIYTKFCSSEVAHRQMWLLAYYMAAVREKEREHMPLLGPSVDRRSLAYVNQVCQSKKCGGTHVLHVWSDSHARCMPGSFVAVPNQFLQSERLVVSTAHP